MLVDAQMRSAAAPTRRKTGKALVFIDHDMIIRHFVVSGAFRELERDFDVTYVFNDDPTTHKKWINVDVDALGLPRVLKTDVTRQRMGSWYPVYAISVLHQQRGTRNYTGRRERMTTINGRRRTYYYTALSLPGVFPIVRWLWLKRQGSHAGVRALLAAERPDLVVHPTILTGYYINELLVETRALGIPFLVLMNSWDNPSQKAVATGFPDRLAVWGAQTRDHAIEFMRMPADKIEILGAAQFEVYRNEPTETDAELRAMFKMPAAKPVILYGGVSKSINETRHLKLLDDAIESGAIGDCHILYRPHPWRGGLIDGETDFFAMKFRHVTMDPFLEGYYRRVVKVKDDAFDMADYQVTRKLLHMIAGTISSMSTIQLETAIVGKPSISFMPRPDMESKYGHSASISARLAHFQGLWECPGVATCDSDEALPDAVNRLLAQAADPAWHRTIREYASRFAVLDGPSYAERLADLAHRMTEGVA